MTDFVSIAMVPTYSIASDPTELYYATNKTVVSSIVVANISSAPLLFSCFVRHGTTDYILCSNMSITGSESLIFAKDMVLNQGDSIYGFTDNISHAVNVFVSTETIN